jgi:DNA modification methylase
VIELHQGDCTTILRDLPSGSVDAVITDPPYPEIDRDYGRMSEPEWHAMMDVVVAECRRILKPTGSAVFILQPNSERVGRMRPWLWEFMAKWTREWGMVQDAWWWNIKQFPTVHPLRPSLKACVWLGSSDCWRDQDEVLWQESQANAAVRMSGRWGMKYNPSGAHNNPGRASLKAAERGGVTPFNVLPTPSDGEAAKHGHGAATPVKLCEWWLRYICPPGGTVCDPFIGSGTVGIAAVKRGCNVIGIERMPKYFEIAQARIEAAQAEREGMLIPA